MFRLIWGPGPGSRISLNFRDTAPSIKQSKHNGSILGQPIALAVWLWMYDFFSSLALTKKRFN